MVSLATSILPGPARTKASDHMSTQPNSRLLKIANEIEGLPSMISESPRSCRTTVCAMEAAGRRVLQALELGAFSADTFLSLRAINEGTIQRLRLLMETIPSPGDAPDHSRRVTNCLTTIFENVANWIRNNGKADVHTWKLYPYGDREAFRVVADALRCEARLAGDAGVNDGGPPLDKLEDPAPLVWLTVTELADLTKVNKGTISREAQKDSPGFKTKRNTKGDPLIERDSGLAWVAARRKKARIQDNAKSEFKPESDDEVIRALKSAGF